MGKDKNGKNGKGVLANPFRLKPLDPEDKQLLQVVIETRKAFPYDFGFIPSTEADDGDPIDVLVLMDEPAFLGCLLKGRIIGVIEGEEIEDGKKTRNDRIVAIEQANHSFEDIKQIHDLGRHFGTNSKSFS